jgi:phosphoribosyl 1,2-cyclic phosphate phosphodiesterase
MGLISCLKMWPILMSNYKITILGCGGSKGVPCVGGPDGKGLWGVCDPAEPKNYRTRSSILIEAFDDGVVSSALLVDASPDFRVQMLATGTTRIDGVLITHAHADHVAGLDDVKPFAIYGQKTMPLYATSDTIDLLDGRFSYIFRSETDLYQPWASLKALPDLSVFNRVIEGVPLALFEQDHGSCASLGLRLGDFAYSTDVINLSPDALTALKGVQTWVVDCFRLEPNHASHAWLDRVLEWRDYLQVPHVYLTHMGMGMDYKSLVTQLPDGVRPCYDGLALFA